MSHERDDIDLAEEGARRSRRRRSPSDSPPPRRRSRSPRERRYKSDRENAPPSKCLGCFNLSGRTTEDELADIFGEYGSLEGVTVVMDRSTGRSRGFGFIYFKYLDDAVEACERAQGMSLDGRTLRVDFSLTERAHTPTPGMYMGKESSRSNPNTRPRTYGSGYDDRDRYSSSRYDDRRDRRDSYRDDYRRSSYRDERPRRSRRSRSYSR